MNVLVCYNPPKEEIAENQFDSKPKIASKLLTCGLPVECAMQYITIFELYSTFPEPVFIQLFMICKSKVMQLGSYDSA